MNRLLEIEAFVLRRYPLGETDRIYSLFSRQGGKIRAVASGALRPKNRWTGIMEPLNEVSAIVHLSRSSDLHKLTQADVRTRFKYILNDLNRLGPAFEILEILDRFTPDAEPNAELYDLTRSVYFLLDQNPELPHLYLRVFQLLFFQYSGYGFSLSQCVKCGKVRGNKAGYFLVDQGGVLCANCILHITHPAAPVSGTTLNMISNIIGGRWNEIDRHSDLKRFFKESESIITSHFAYYFEKLPRSTALLNEPPGID
jgi:DNA repair protein RecO (recombination protein O)